MDSILQEAVLVSAENGKGTHPRDSFRLADVDGSLPAHHAAAHGCSSMFAVLVSLGYADTLLAKDKCGLTPAALLCKGGHAQGLHALVDALMSEQAHAQLGKKYSQSVRAEGRTCAAWLVQGFQLDTMPPEMHHCTIVHLAAMEGKVKCLNALVELDVRFDNLDVLELFQKPDNVGKTPAHYAAENGQAKVLNGLRLCLNALQRKHLIQEVCLRPWHCGLQTIYMHANDILARWVL